MSYSPASTRIFVELVFDSTGSNLISPGSMSHTYGYDGSSNLTTDTVTDNSGTWIKTYTYSGTTLTGESAWVKQ
jgi:hypothetical protein